MGHIWSRPPPVRSRNGGRNATPDAGTSQGTKDWYVIVNPCHTVLDDVNALLLQHGPDLLNMIHIHTSNADTALDLAITVLNNFKL